MPPRSLPLLAVAVSVVIWSTGYVTTEIALRTTSPAVLSVLRFAIALVLLLPFTIARPDFFRHFWSVNSAIFGLTGVSIYYAFANIGMLFTTAGTAALLSALLPVFTAGFAVWLLRERLSARAIIGLALATAGVALSASSGFRLDLGVDLMLLGLVGYSLYTVLLRRQGEQGRPADPMMVSAVTALWGTLFMIPWMLWEIATGQARFPSGFDGVAATIFLGLIVSGVTLVLYSYGAPRIPAAVSGIMSAGIPVLGYAIAVIAGETATWPKTIGGALAITGILVATARRTALRDGRGTDAEARATVAVPPDLHSLR